MRETVLRAEWALIDRVVSPDVHFVPPPSAPALGMLTEEG
jgi:hypothetical protein